MRDLEKNLTELKLPKSGGAALLRFGCFVLAGVVLYYLFPGAWDGWLVALAAGFVGGVLWSVSWLSKGMENRVIAWLILYLGCFIFWFSFAGQMPSWIHLFCMSAGYECAGLLFYPLLRRRAGDSRGDGGIVKH